MSNDNFTSHLALGNIRELVDLLTSEKVEIITHPNMNQMFTRAQQNVTAELYCALEGYPLRGYSTCDVLVLYCSVSE